MEDSRKYTCMNERINKYGKNVVLKKYFAKNRNEYTQMAGFKI